MSSSETRWLGGYHLQRRLGAGGAGTVWEATDEGGMRVALKILHPIVAATEEARRRLEREARLVNQIPGSGIARVIDFETEATSPFVVTELIEGPTLAEIIADSPLTASEAFHLAVQLEDLLHRVHNEGIVHRDLKPSNIIVSEQGPVLIDFGIAQAAADDRLTQTGKTTGTPGFVSPELLATANPLFEQWRIGDWWAWNALLLNCLTGQLPFGEGRTETVLQRVQRGEPELHGLPDEVQRTFLNAFDPDPRNRPDPWEIIEELNRVKGFAPDTVALTAPRPATLYLDSHSDSVAPADSAAPGAPGGPGSPVTPPPPPSPTFFPTHPPLHQNHPGQVAAGGQAPPGFFPPFPLHPLETSPGPTAYTDSHALPILPAPYSPEPVKPYPLALVAFIAGAALLPVWWGGTGLALGVLSLLLLATLGVGHRWLEKRRLRSGGGRRSDTPLSVTLLPWHLLIGGFQMLPGLAVGALVGAAGWYLYFWQLGNPEIWLGTLDTWVRTADLSGIPASIVWLIAGGALLTAALFPTSFAARRALWVTVATVLPQKRLRIAAYLLVVFAVLGSLLAMTVTTF